VSKVRQKEETKADIVSHDREKPVGLDAEEFLQVSYFVIKILRTYTVVCKLYL
jgi:hypothetical protein